VPVAPRTCERGRAIVETQITRLTGCRCGSGGGGAQRGGTRPCGPNVPSTRARLSRPYIRSFLTTRWDAYCER
jgi:hypothetical protein